jgi:hypothetical protein
MPNTLQDFLATTTEKAAKDLVIALLRLPEDKRNWSPGGDARTPLDLVAECALNTGYTADLIITRQWAAGTMDEYLEKKSEMVTGNWEALHTLLQENTQRVIAAIRTVPDGDLGDPISMPWFTQELSGVIAYPYWNMSYHEGQINYVASILGCLE